MHRIYISGELDLETPPYFQKIRPVVGGWGGILFVLFPPPPPAEVEPGVVWGSLGLVWESFWDSFVN